MEIVDLFLDPVIHWLVEFHALAYGLPQVAAPIDSAKKSIIVGGVGCLAAGKHSECENNKQAEIRAGFH